MYINNLGHMTKMAAMSIYGENPSKIFFYGLISMKLGMKHQWLKYYNVYINHDPAMPMTQFMARSPWVVNAFEWENMFIGICSRSQVSVYRTIGPLVYLFFL